MKNDRRFQPGDEVKVMFPPKESEGEDTGTVISFVHNNTVEVEFKNGNKATIQAGDLTRLDR